MAETKIVKFEQIEEKQIEQALLVHNMMTDYVQRTMKKGTDYGLIPGTNKPTLLKPGTALLLAKKSGISARVISVLNVEKIRFLRASITMIITATKRRAVVVRTI